MQRSRFREEQIIAIWGSMKRVRRSPVRMAEDQRASARGPQQIAGGPAQPFDHTYWGHSPPSKKQDSH